MGNLLDALDKNTLQWQGADPEQRSAQTPLDGVPVSHQGDGEQDGRDVRRLVADGDFSPTSGYEDGRRVLVSPPRRRESDPRSHGGQDRSLR